MTMRTLILRTLAVWAFVWPLVTGLLLLLQAALPDLPTAARTFLLTAMLVPTISLAIGPLVARLIRSDPPSN
ncbi:MAG: hypothetical protein V2I43_03185 [Parvularcula sp.]|jgi:antibiotic biosynthesis monooxygenase (ABM) superfamily enzyme|nr:hypothetical protein [Parvularcula sp.]